MPDSAILGEPTRRQQPERRLHLRLLGCASGAAKGSKMVGEINGRLDTREGDAPLGTESRGAFRLGGRVTHGTVSVDGGIILGLTSHDTSFGFTAGLTWVFRGEMRSSTAVGSLRVVGVARYVSIS